MVFDQQSNVKIVDNLFSQARGTQVGWLREENYENGMSETVSKTYQEAVDKGITEWETVSKQARDMVCTQTSMIMQPLDSQCHRISFS